jgi:hypothetical protein
MSIVIYSIDIYGFLCSGVLVDPSETGGEPDGSNQKHHLDEVSNSLSSIITETLQHHAPYRSLGRSVVQFGVVSNSL